MKTQCGVLLCAAMCLFIHVARAGNSDLNITCEKKKLESKANSTTQGHTDEVKKSERWGYAVTVENQGFKALANLEVRYVIFYKHSELGIKGPPRKKTVSGTYTIPAIESLGKTSFNTDSVELTKASLVGSLGGYSYFDNGAKGSVADTISGIWIRVYQNGNLFCEYASPSELTSTATWPE